MDAAGRTHLDCAAHDCPEPADAATGYCIAHGNLVCDFHRWLLNANGAPDASGSFDAARLLWEQARRLRAG